MPPLELEARPFSEVNHVGVVIQRTEHGLHSGLLYQLPNSEPRILHLAFHHMLRDEPAALPYRWSDMGLDEDNKLVLATLLSRIAATEPRINYGFDSDGACFDPETGDMLPLPIGKGLTCATFIVAALRTYRFRLLDPATWPERPEDREWEEAILNLLAEYATADHVEAVRSSVGAKRLRPDEVVGAATLSDDYWPASFQSARGLADQILADLN